MLQTTSGVTRKFISNNNEFLETSKEIAKRTLNLVDSSIVDVFENRAIGGSPCEVLRFISSLETKSDFERTVKSHMIFSTYKLEQKSPLAGYLFLRLLAGEKFESLPARRLQKSDVDKLLTHAGDDTVESLAKNAIMLAGGIGNISVFMGGITHLSVEDSASFPIIVSPSFVNAKSQNFRKICIYNGVIESVGEVNALLEESARNKASVLLIARAFASDVVSTIYANNNRGVFDIVPITPGTSVADEFTMFDIASITGAKLLNKISLNDAPECKVLIEGSKLKVTISDKKLVNTFVKQLRSDTNDFRDHDVLKIISERISRTSSRRISVCIGNEFGSGQGVAKDKFDFALRSYIASRQRGVIEIGEVIYPGNALNLAEQALKSYESLINETGGTLVIDSKMALA